MSKARLEAFSDGVFAVAITLLVLEIAVPGEHGDLAHEVADLWPSFAGYLVSFATIGIIWVNHHTISTKLICLTGRRCPQPQPAPGGADPVVDRADVEHLRDTDADEHLAAAIYAANFSSG